MSWPMIVVIGAILNVVVNYGYKITASGGGILWLSAAVMFLGSMSAWAYALYRKMDFGHVVEKKSLVILPILGFGILLILVCFFSAMASGPISLIDPMWACVYSLASVCIGMMIIRERPKPKALAGIVLYLIGAALMSMGETT